MVLASDGQKMSKRKKNYPNPVDVVDKYGADALRLYLINSPVVRAENLRFKEEGVRDVIKDVFLPWYNAFRFLMQNIESYVQDTGELYVFEETKIQSNNKMDRWIASYSQSLLAFVKKEMAAYRLYTVVPRLTKFIDNLTNWYVRMNRKRLKGEQGIEDTKHALNTLFSVLLLMVKIMAPFAPFITEIIYQYLLQVTKGYTGKKESIHYLMLPSVNEALIDESIERSIARMQVVVELGRVLRDRKTIPIKYPLPELVVIHRSPEFISDILSLEPYILSELNVRNLTLSSDKTKYGITLRAEPDHKTLGLRLKAHFKSVTQSIKALNDSQIEKLLQDKSMIIDTHEVALEEIRVIFDTNAGTNKYEANSDNDCLILLDVTPDQAMLDEGLAREIINRIQKLRKKAHLVPTDMIKVFYETKGEMERIAKSHKEFIETTIKATFEPLRKDVQNGLIEETTLCKGDSLKLVIVKESSGVEPVTNWLNICLVNVKPRFNNLDKYTIVYNNEIGLESLKKSIEKLFGIFGMDYQLWCDGAIVDSTKGLNSKTIYVTPTLKPEFAPVNVDGPFSKFVNIKKGDLKTTWVHNLDQCDTPEIVSRRMELFYKLPIGSIQLKDDYNHGTMMEI